MTPQRRALVLSGGPAVGKTSTGRSLACLREHAAFIDADDIRQLVVAGAVPLWRGPSGAAQHALATRNTTAMMTNVLDAGFDVVVADFLTAATCELYRASTPEALLVHLTASRKEVRRRAKMRHVYLTEEEFEHLHDLADEPLAVDYVLDVGRLSPSEQLDAVREIWEAAT